MMRAQTCHFTLAIAGLVVGCGGSEFTNGGQGGAGATTSSSSGSTSSSGIASSTSSGMASSSSTSSTSSGMASSTSSGMASSSSGVVGSEDCTNGIDDNGDSLVDCADPQCAAYVCAAPPPGGWFGPVELATVLKDNGLPVCDTDYTAWKSGATGAVGNDAATCTACGCGKASPACGAPTFNLDAVACDSQIKNVTPPDASCQSIGMGGVDALGIFASKPPPLPVACVPSGGVATVPPGGFSEVAGACVAQATGKGCAIQTRVCTPKPGAGFQSKLCVVQPGDVACPGFPYVNKTVFYENPADTRGCTGCACTPPAVTPCTGKATFFTSGGCPLAGGILVVADGLCHDLFQTVKLSSYIYTPGPGNVPSACAIAGGQPTGSVQGHNPDTVCCE